MEASGHSVSLGAANDGTELNREKIRKSVRMCQTVCGLEQELKSMGVSCFCVSYQPASLPKFDLDEQITQLEAMIAHMQGMLTKPPATAPVVGHSAGIVTTIVSQQTEANKGRKRPLSSDGDDGPPPAKRRWRSSSNFPKQLACKAMTDEVRQEVAASNLAPSLGTASA